MERKTRKKLERRLRFIRVQQIHKQNSNKHRAHVSQALLRFIRVQPEAGFEEMHRHVIMVLGQCAAVAGERVAASLNQHRGFTLSLLQANFRRGIEGLKWVHPDQFFLVTGASATDDAIDTIFENEDVDDQWTEDCHGDTIFENDDVNDQWTEDDHGDTIFENYDATDQWTEDCHGDTIFENDDVNDQWTEDCHGDTIFEYDDVEDQWTENSHGSRQGAPDEISKCLILFCPSAETCPIAS